ncbi:hypothetical protein G647_09870 [Cladophialophora carrionii CBS 160.54]|uniref:Coenzyme Q-binding protein COQ10 START domain-containing protein n=1 Tax=Cladophialophora carrionii CBS 160.54 TaxID=1279043 RepID=V9DMJ6_9EURO|nr:uncharacterized protein G647_09870 [Cladophialophora carrionii CBS 160.54]ETI27187.1 hypothetical protein G647_09870 [Cladophialophora carrionii CBS 160.54]
MPAQALTSVVINAPAQQVWDVLTDFDRWPDWNTWFTAMHAHSMPPQLGTQVTFTNRMSETAKPGTYTARITTWKPEAHEFAWKGGPLPEMMGWLLMGNHSFRLVEQDGGKRTLFHHGEGVEGILGVLVPQSLVKDLVTMLDKFNAELKRRIEVGVQMV